MIQIGIEAQDGGRVIIKGQLQFGSQSVRAERNSSTQNALAFQILDDVFSVGTVVFVIDQIDVNFRWLRLIASYSSKPVLHGVFIAAFGTVLYTTRCQRSVSCECNYQPPQGS